MELFTKLLSLLTSLDDFGGDFQGWLMLKKSISHSPVYLFVAIFFFCVFVCLFFCFPWQNNPFLPRLVNCSGNGGAAECVLAEEALSCVCLPESKPLLSFQVGFFDLLPLAPSLPLPLPSQPHQWFSFFGVNIPADCVCFGFFVCFVFLSTLHYCCHWALWLMLREACNGGEITTQVTPQG